MFAHICLPQNLCGTEYDNMFVVGCIDGFFPQRNAFEVIGTDRRAQPRHGLRAPRLHGRRGEGQASS